jgi:hypothetical protein
MKDLKWTLGLFLCALMIFSCDHDHNDGVSGAITCNLTDTVTYLNDVAPLVESNCNGGSCHGVGSSNGDYMTHAGILGDAQSGVIKEQIESGAMPIGGILTDAEKQIFICWVEQGALNNGTITDTTITEDTATNTDTTVIDTTTDEDTIVVELSLCDTSDITYANSMQRLIDTKCAFSGCHGNGSSFGDYTSLGNIGSAADSAGHIFIRVVIQMNMPKGSVTITQAQRDSIECWTNKGGL